MKLGLLQLFKPTTTLVGTLYSVVSNECHSRDSHVQVPPKGLAYYHLQEQCHQQRMPIKGLTCASSVQGHHITPLVGTVLVGTVHGVASNECHSRDSHTTTG